MSEFWDKQMSHEPTRLYYEKLKEVINIYFDPQNYKTLDQFGKAEVLEIGLDVGISARCFLEYPNIKLTSIDPGEVDIGIREINDLKFDKRWTFHHMSSDKYFADCKKQFDIIYVDGDHSYTQCKKDIDNAWKFIKPAGTLIGHDFLHKSNFYHDKECGVTQAFREFICEKNVEAHIYPPNPGLIVIKK